MKKPKIDPNKIISVKPRMVKEGPDVGSLFAMIIGFLLGMILITLVSCEEQKSEPVV
jgi:tetrahydromethanopterin S-methyltransferase subunit G